MGSFDSNSDGKTLIAHNLRNLRTVHHWYPREIIGFELDRELLIGSNMKKAQLETRKKNLQLSTETVRNLEADDLKVVTGGRSFGCQCLDKLTG